MLLGGDFFEKPQIYQEQLLWIDAARIFVYFFAEITDFDILFVLPSFLRE